MHQTAQVALPARPVRREKPLHPWPALAQRSVLLLESPSSLQRHPQVRPVHSRAGNHRHVLILLVTFPLLFLLRYLSLLLAASSGGLRFSPVSSCTRQTSDTLICCVVSKAISSLA